MIFPAVRGSLRIAQHHKQRAAGFKVFMKDKSATIKPRFKKHISSAIRGSVAGLEEEISQTVLDAMRGIEIFAHPSKRGEKRTLTFTVINDDCEDLTKPITLMQLLRSWCQNGWEPDQLAAVIADLKGALAAMEREYRRHT